MCKRVIILSIYLGDVLCFYALNCYLCLPDSGIFLMPLLAQIQVDWKPLTALPKRLLKILSPNLRKYTYMPI